MNSHIKSYLDSNRIPYEVNVDLKKKTWIRRGGIAELYITPANSNELEGLVIFLYSNNIKFLLIGHTSNIYILNSCNISVVISTVRCRKFELKENKVICESGVGVINFSRRMILQGYKGFEYLTGLPGTIGAALVNNSSCKSNSISDLLISARVVLSDGTIKTFTKDDFKYEFRSSVFKSKLVNGIIISAVLSLVNGDSAHMQKIASDNDSERKQILEGNSQNLGCTVNRCFINGKMPLYLRMAIRLNSLISKILITSEIERNEQRKRFICSIAGFRDIIPYVSSKNVIIFKWVDEGADAAFPRYLEFMQKVYKTDKVEIEIIG